MYTVYPVIINAKRNPIHFHPTLARNFDGAGPLEWIAANSNELALQFLQETANPWIIIRFEPIIHYGAYSQAWRGRERPAGRHV